MKKTLLPTIAGIMILPGTFAACQQIDLSAPPPKPTQVIKFVAEEQVIHAGKRAIVEMRFRVVDGYHVNSHKPLSDLLIPTVLKLDAADGVKTEDALYPAGTPYVLRFQTEAKLDVYTGMFTLRIPVVASAGMHTVNGTLRYQACDNASCYPPRYLPVQLLLTAK